MNSGDAMNCILGCSGVDVDSVTAFTYYGCMEREHVYRHDQPRDWDAAELSDSVVGL